jgi:hypothetical protein
MTAGSQVLLIDLDGAAPATWVSLSGSSRPRHPGMEVAVIQDAPSEFAHQFMYPGGGFALGNAFGWVQIVDRQGLFAGLARTCRI